VNLPEVKGSPPIGRYVRVGVCAGGEIVTDVILPPESSVILGSHIDCTVLVPERLGIERLLIIEAGRQLYIAQLQRVILMGDGPEDHIRGTPDELWAGGVASPAVLRWRRMNLTVAPSFSVFVKYLPLGESVDLKVGGWAAG